MPNLFVLRLFNLNRNVRSFVKPAANWNRYNHIRLYSNESNHKHLVPSFGFVDIKNKNKETYLEMINIFLHKDKDRRGQVEFIYAALKHMKDFGVEKDLEVYKKLIDVFPKGKMVPRNLFQAEFMHYPKHQQCAIDLLEQMEELGVMPDWSMEDQLVSVFGKRAHPLRRYWRMMYWMPRFKNASPWLLPEDLPNDTIELAKLAVSRMTSVDPTTVISVYQTTDIADSLEDTWIVSGQSKTQQLLTGWLPQEATLYVDGGFRLWLKDRAITYFTLTTEPFRKFEEQDYDDVSNLMSQLTPKQPDRTVHEEDNAVVLGVACSGTSTPDSVLSWIRALSNACPRLQQLQILFRVSHSVRDQATPPPPAIRAPPKQITSAS
ncbi:evolutionarily conserved signaling intermediate in Toll pathway, mitochondrial isoform X2 [Halyomorpha halys]|uniref:evolutionarily conserved signaling intermediate in Toll pathway, mitochondrial isoform X2 n=1 Tax=Halyomorpha halys TaxID=286706 RepID=UPI0006D51E32|nr:evolutionarily conserved signaling intermediate in Toll pathway, mitochondrial isoform X2 [Halyomorpha halys]